MRQGHRVNAIAEHAGLAWTPYMSKPDVFPSGVIDLHRGGRSRKRELPPGSWAWVE